MSRYRIRRATEDLGEAPWFVFDVQTRFDLCEDHGLLQRSILDRQPAGPQSCSGEIDRSLLAIRIFVGKLFHLSVIAEDERHESCLSKVADGGGLLVRLSGNTGSGTFNRSDGCIGTWIAIKREALRARRP
jgi:hypothetical protein